MTRLFKDSMIVGYLFVENYYDDYRTDEWKGSEECSLFAAKILGMAKIEHISIEEAFEKYANKFIDEINEIETAIECHMWDDICKGFLAGEIIGLPTEENLKKVKRAEKLWDDPDYGYYQEVLNEVV